MINTLSSLIIYKLVLVRGPIMKLGIVPVYGAGLGLPTNARLIITSYITIDIE